MANVLCGKMFSALGEVPQKQRLRKTVLRESSLVKLIQREASSIRQERGEGLGAEGTSLCGAHRTLKLSGPCLSRLITKGEALLAPTLKHEWSSVIPLDQLFGCLLLIVDSQAPVGACA